MIIVTGGAGFIGSNIIKALNAHGQDNILVVDNLSNGVKFQNLADCDIADYMDKAVFLARVEAGESFGRRLEGVFHQGACSATTEWDGRYLMHNNYRYSKALLHWCLERRVPYYYASSASVYGVGRVFREARTWEKPLNVYGYSKFLFDQYVRRQLPYARSPVAGLRYFNVYGPREQHKGGMASVACHFHKQLQESRQVRLFEGSGGYTEGEQRRDFIYVGDAAAVNLWLLAHPAVSGIFNVGTGRSRSFNDLARAAIAWHGRGEIVYIPFPERLRGRYQSFTEADISALRAAGYTAPFRTVEEGVRAYLDWLHETGHTDNG